MKRRRCTTCKHTMKGHKRSKCSLSISLFLSDGSKYVGSAHNKIPYGSGKQTMPNGDCYQGEFINGVRQGKGILTTKRFVYDGEWFNNRFNGYGKISYRSGESYEGDFKDGQRHGIGCFIKTPVDWYKGDWAHNIRCGNGVKSTSLGIYKGRFQNDKQHGKGVMVYTNGHSYDGFWSKDVRCGFGIFKTLAFSYEGHWSNDQYHGSGTLKCVQTGMYEGMWKYGLRHRKGRQIYLNKDVYDGKWCKNLRCGYGTYKHANGDLYKGTWVNDMKNGHGSFETSSYLYTGEWLDNQKEGKGTVVENNYTLSGTWVKNKRHGIFEKCGKKSQKLEKQLWVEGNHIRIQHKKDVHNYVVRWLKQQKYEAAKWAASFFPSVLTWTFIIKPDTFGNLVSLKDKTTICSFLKNKVWSLFKKEKYDLIKACVNQLPEETLAIAMEHDKVKILFDSLTDEFEPNPWIVSQASYSKQTREKLLKGLHYGEFGRCNPIDPFTRQKITASSGVFLAENLKYAKKIWNLFKKCLSTHVEIRRLEYEFNMNDYEELLNNARETNDTNTMRIIMKERDDYITRERSSSLCGV